MPAHPSSQKAAACPIGFALDDGVSGNLTIVNLYIRPEDLQKVDPVSGTATRTFGGGWSDIFGQGLSKIQISGHTGWRGSPALDGAALFQQLYTQIYQGWLQARATAVAQGQSPDVVKLMFVDTLNSFSGSVQIDSFVLKRSRARPLLAMYAISMTVLDTDLSNVLGSGGDAQL